MRTVDRPAIVARPVDRSVTVRMATAADLPATALMMREVLDTDFGGYQARWHRDLDDLAATYLQRPGHALFVAHAPDGVLGAAAVRPCALASPPNPEWLVAEYNRPDTCELVRVWVSGAARRRGVGRRLVEGATSWAVGEGGYRRVYLHTNASVPGAEAFWRALPTRLIHDCRPDPYHCVHFEVDTPALLGAAAE